MSAAGRWSDTNGSVTARTECGPGEMVRQVGARVRERMSQLLCWKVVGRVGLVADMQCRNCTKGSLTPQADAGVSDA